jgi:uncharacterized protein YjaZ
MEFTTDPEIDIAVHDDGDALTALFRLPVEDRAAALEAINRLGEKDPIAPMLAAAHRSGDGFRVDSDDPRYPQALARMVNAGAWKQVERELQRAWNAIREALPSIQHPNRIDVQLTLGNPDDDMFINQTLGYYGMGSMPGRIWLVQWPTDYNLPRIGACAVHEFSHNLRYSNLGWTGGVGEWVIAEGIAEAFAAEVCGPDSTSGWYQQLSKETVDAAEQKVLAAFDSAENSSAYVLGDATAAKMGGTAIGMPHMGGYAVGRRMVDRYLQATGKSAAATTIAPHQDILQAIRAVAS